jgi:hypothetical protein
MAHDKTERPSDGSVGEGLKKTVGKEGRARGLYRRRKRPLNPGGPTLCYKLLYKLLYFKFINIMEELGGAFECTTVVVIRVDR